MLVRATRVAIFTLVLSSCSSAATIEPPSLPALSFPQMDTERSTVTIDVLASDASDPGSLASLLEDAGFRAGVERTYAGPGERFSLAVTRLVAFDDVGGAEAYLAWLREHPSDLIGVVEPLAPLDLPGSPFLTVHVPGGCCPKEVPIYLTAWRRGSRVVSLRVSGRGLERAVVEDLAGRLDTALDGSARA
jgi:hypothetical protein